MRALVVSNMLPDAASPERGRFVRDQLDALRGLDGLDVELYEFAPGPRALARAAADMRRAFARRGASADRSAPHFDVVHAHFGLTAWPALAVPARVRALTVHGTDLLHSRTRLATRAVLPRIDLIAAVSASLASELPARAARRAQVLPCGVDVERFRPLPRAHARAELGLDPERPYLLFPADPARPEKRHDRALALARAVGVELLALGGVAPERVPLLINAATAVVVPSEREGFGLAVLEALACDVPVLATPVGIHADALGGIAGTLCAPFELASWRAALDPHLAASTHLDGTGAGAEAADRVEGRSSAMRFSASRMAERVAGAWRAALERSG